LKENDPEHTSGLFDLTSHGDAKFRGCRDDCHVPKNDLHQPGNRGIALIGTSPPRTQTVSKTNPVLSHAQPTESGAIGILASLSCQYIKNYLFQKNKIKFSGKIDQYHLPGDARPSRNFLCVAAISSEFAKFLADFRDLSFCFGGFLP
jgi:hypothetical protein